MKARAQLVSLQTLLPWRDCYRQEMACQIIHDSLHVREGWTQSYLLLVKETPVGYGAVVRAGPWAARPTVFEFFVSPRYRIHVFALFRALWSASEALAIETQTNDPLLTAMLHTFCTCVTCESILFHDTLTTFHAPPAGAIFRAIRAEDAARTFPHEREPCGDWLVEVDGQIAGTGGILFHYNRPYGDLYLEVAEPFRRRGIGTFLIQELKRVCYEQGSVPTARCRPDNVASRDMLQKAGLAPCGHILSGTLDPAKNT